jgi:hypothetical protein
VTVREYVGDRQGHFDFYCPKCGAELLMVEKDLGTFDTWTGKREIITRGRCPNAGRFFSWGHETWGSIALLPELNEK